MLLHDFLRRKAAILAKAKAEVDNLLTEITDSKTKEAVNDWKPGDPITDEYPQVDQTQKDVPDLRPDKTSIDTVLDTRKKDDTESQNLGEVIHTNAAEVKAAIESSEMTGQNQADASAQLNHQPEGQPQQQPASGNPPA